MKWLDVPNTWEIQGDCRKLTFEPDTEISINNS